MKSLNEKFNTMNYNPHTRILFIIVILIFYSFNSFSQSLKQIELIDKLNSKLELYSSSPYLIKCNKYGDLTIEYKFVLTKVNRGVIYKTSFNLSQINIIEMENDNTKIFHFKCINGNCMNVHTIGLGDNASVSYHDGQTDFVNIIGISPSYSNEILELFKSLKSSFNVEQKSSKK